MIPLYRRMCTAVTVIGLCTQLAAAQEAPKPLLGSELMALVAGNSLSETIVQEIGAKGVSFQPDDKYHSLLSETGADPRVLAALDKAKVNSNADSADRKEANPLLKHLASVGPTR